MGVIQMIPYFWGDMPAKSLTSGGLSGVTFSSLLRDDLGLRDLPEEVRSQMEHREGTLRSSQQLEAMINELSIQQ